MSSSPSPSSSVSSSLFATKGTPVPRIGLGLAALGRPGYINLGRSEELSTSSERSVELMKEQTFQVLDAAWACGVRYFDAARSYGRAEEFLSSWLESRKVESQDVCIGSKWGYRYTAEWRIDTGGAPHEVKDHSTSHFLKQQQETLHLLKDHLRLYQIHSATLESGVLENEELLNEMRRFKAENGVGLGLSLSGTQQAQVLEAALKIPMEEGGDLSQGRLFDSVQATWNLAEQSAGEALHQARVADLQVIVKEAMGNGRLLKGSASPSLRKLADHMGCSPDALALACVLLQPFQPLVLSGAATPDQMRSNFEAVSLSASIQADPSKMSLVQSLMNEVRMSPDEYWNERSQLKWN
ncbi:hypothetical protein GUITHDRAFT_83863 [Guillardia theta CCMP2712]|uniref:NADP-dependent oxidoreductase domain-containing protein n=1 Tax=Guillardia theta (strain CCMP2712) TaxID=905079 RepID=L1K381_GUITC|nr:hypothetical protein GUITHDRAFT_83863 [Guillardia theta CCMP2712]EKX54915.1 hypothetical protein GUITHDRAFT_83863 [Guillardia theta CCMP2712]|eukprot:XP_005841895.1 hypothetical protein GUITHDRAFT_83863 [Guillardia theta CCMP2712]